MASGPVSEIVPLGGPGALAIERSDMHNVDETGQARPPVSDFRGVGRHDSSS